MKKILATVIALALALSLCIVFASAAPGDAVAIKGITFASTTEGVVESVPQAGGDLNTLIDGDLLESASAFGTKGIVLFKNTHCTTAGEYPEFTLTVELEKVANVTGASITLYEELSSMIGTPKDGIVTVEYSEDGTDFVLLNDLELGCVDANAEWEAKNQVQQVETCEVSFGAIVSAKFIRFTFAYGDSPFDTDGKVVWEWIGLTEVAVDATEAGGAVVDPSEDPSEAPSEAPSEQPSTPVESSTPATSSEGPSEPTSDSGIAALAVISALAIAGAFIVKKSR